MGTGRNAIKGIITRNSRCATISLNSSLPKKTQDSVVFHEIGHYVLKHHQRKQVCAFQDYDIFNSHSCDPYLDLENEANIFVAEYLLEDQRTLDALKETNDFFHAAAILRVPKEILDYKMRMLRYYHLLTDTAACPISTRRSFMSHIDCSGLEGDDFA